MQVSIETTSGLERRLTVGVPAERINNEVNTRLQKAAKEMRVNGFRAGKIPMSVVKQRVGAAIRQEVLGEVVNQTFYEAIQQESISPAGQPSIEPNDSKDGDGFEYVATFEVFPEIALGDFSVIEVEQVTADVQDSDVDSMIEVLRNQNKTWNALDRAAASDDQVNIDFLGTKDGVEFDGGKAEATDLILGSNSMIPGFEDGIVGMKTGEEKTLDLTFPEEYQVEELKGAAVQFVVKVNTVSESVPAELNDEFFERFGVKEGGEEKFREDVKANMIREVAQAVKNKAKNQIMDGVLSMQSIDVPKALVDMEVDQLRKQAVQQFGGGQNLDPSMLPAEMFTEQAKRRVSLGLIINEVIKANELSADKDKVKAMIEEMAATYQDPQEVINYYYSNEQQLASVESAVLEEQVVDFIMSQAKVSSKQVSYEEAIKPPAPPAETSDEEDK